MNKIFNEIVSGLKEAIDYQQAVAKGRPIPRGTQVTNVKIPDKVDVKAIRHARGMTQEQFSNAFALPLDSIKNWESGRRKPDGAARILLCVIDKHPEAVTDSLTCA